MKPYIHHSFWSDSEVENQPAEVKLCALWIITNSQRTILGVCEATTRRFCFETGLDADVFNSVCEKLPGMFVKIGEAILIRNFIRHQYGSGDKLKRNNFFKALAAEFKGLREPLLRREILSEYPEFSSVNGESEEGLGKPLPRGTQAQGKESTGKERKAEGSGEPTEPPAENPPPAPPALPLTNHQVEPYKAQLRQHKPFVAAWKDWLRHLEEKDKPMTAMQEDMVLAECARNGAGRSEEVLRYSILKGAKNPLWDAPRSKNTRDLPGSGSPEPDPIGFKRWLAEAYPDKDGTPFDRCPDSVKEEFKRWKRGK